MKCRIEIVEDVVFDLANTPDASPSVLEIARDYLQLLRNMIMTDMCTHGFPLDPNQLTPIPEVHNDDYNTTDEEAAIIDLT